MTAFAAAFAAALLAASAAAAQSMPDMPGMNAPSPPDGAEKAGGHAPGRHARSGEPTSPADGSTQPMAAMMAGQLGSYPMTRDASGTSWQPDSTPMHGLSWALGGWAGMVHGYADLVFDRQSGPRGADETFSESMLMAMAQHPLGRATLTLRSMISLDPLMGKAGYPLLLQTGETADGVTPLIDRQHPHDFLMELAGAVSAPIGADTSAFLYVGYPGEPAIGPPTFMHRVSGEDDPAAPITHHWLDSTHITFGVITAGLVHGPFKLEGSVFNGREPDQHRWDFDRFRLDSWSARLSFNPAPSWALQISYGWIHSPEQLSPEVNQRRFTASAIYDRRLAGGDWQTTFAYGLDENRPGHDLSGWLLESAFSHGRHTLFGRAETVAKDELFDEPSRLAGHVFQVAELSLGYVYDLPLSGHLALGLGVAGTMNIVPDSIRFAYGADPFGVMPFARLKIR